MLHRFTQHISKNMTFKRTSTQKISNNTIYISPITTQIYFPLGALVLVAQNAVSFWLVPKLWNNDESIVPPGTLSTPDIRKKSAVGLVALNIFCNVVFVMAARRFPYKIVSKETEELILTFFFFPFRRTIKYSEVIMKDTNLLQEPYVLATKQGVFELSKKGTFQNIQNLYQQLINRLK
eukprot:TRINITY_DN10596_c0_g1_i1.p1 TRINITY_DN10596_c0_g1~~TRINITY_DN10596_c0_g1_i1.p1  ORF type:complete len:179 (-),score=29.57 TRINITY_DN10596_c0_g1_i1:7-543(-)